MNWAKQKNVCLNVCNFLHVNHIFKNYKYYMGELQKHAVTEAKHTKNHILYDYIYTKYPE